MSINVPQFSEVATGTIGFPRVGKDRELKKALESYWAGTTDRTHLLDVAAQVEKANLLAQVDAGIERIGVGSFSLYDQVLDWTFRLGLIPARFANSGKVRTHAPFLCDVSMRRCACATWNVCVLRGICV
jgi:5-methyltetrahydropteroyltriglutamate--homocysteine methyltransferase